MSLLNTNTEKLRTISNAINNLSSGGGGSITTNGKSYQMYTTDAEGRAKWADQLGYIEKIPTCVEQNIIITDPFGMEQLNFDFTQFGEYMAAKYGEDVDIESILLSSLFEIAINDKIYYMKPRTAMIEGELFPYFSNVAIDVTNPMNSAFDFLIQFDGTICMPKQGSYTISMNFISNYKAIPQILRQNDFFAKEGEEGYIKNNPFPVQEVILASTSRNFSIDDDTWSFGILVGSNQINSANLCIPNENSIYPNQNLIIKINEQIYKTTITQVDNMYINSDATHPACPVTLLFSPTERIGYIRLNKSMFIENTNITITLSEQYIAGSDYAANKGPGYIMNRTHYDNSMLPILVNHTVTDAMSITHEGISFDKLYMIEWNNEKYYLYPKRSKFDDSHDNNGGGNPVYILGNVYAAEPESVSITSQNDNNIPFYIRCTFASISIYSINPNTTNVISIYRIESPKILDARFLPNYNKHIVLFDDGTATPIMIFYKDGIKIHQAGLIEVSYQNEYATDSGFLPSILYTYQFKNALDLDFYERFIEEFSENITRNFLLNSANNVEYFNNHSLKFINTLHGNVSGTAFSYNKDLLNSFSGWYYNLGDITIRICDNIYNQEGGGADEPA